MTGESENAEPEGIKIVRDIDMIKIGIEETRMRILALLRLNNLTVSQIADILEKDQSTIYRHIEKLEKAGYVYPSGERKTHHIPEKIYSRTAKVFLLVPEGGDISDKERIMKEQGVERKLCLFDLMKKMGIINAFSREDVEEFAELLSELEEESARYMEAIKDEKNVGLRAVWQLESIILLLKYRRDEEFRRRINQIFSRIERGS